MLVPWALKNMANRGPSLEQWCLLSIVATCRKFFAPLHLPHSIQGQLLTKVFVLMPKCYGPWLAK